LGNETLAKNRGIGDLAHSLISFVAVPAATNASLGFTFGGLRIVFAKLGTSPRVRSTKLRVEQSSKKEDTAPEKSLL
jgi:hypothetical protein